MASGQYRNLVIVQQAGAPTPNADGSYDDTWTDANPAEWYVSVTPATARDMEAIAAGTVLSQATHLVRGHYRPDITTTSRLLFGVRVLAVVSVTNPDEADVELVVACVEVVG